MNRKNNHFNSIIAGTYAKEKQSVAKIRKMLNDNGIDIPDNIGFYDIYQKELRNELYDEMTEDEKYKHEYNSHNKYFKYFVSGFDVISDISPQDISRLMMLCTYISHGNYLVRDTSNDKLDINDLKKILNIPKETFRRTIKSLKESGYLIRKDDGYQISSDIFHYGKDSFRPLKESERYTKMYKLAIRSVYNTLKPNQHKILGYMFKLIPYASADFWVLCKNPLEMNRDKVIPLSLDEICEIVGYSLENKRRLRGEINKVIFTYKGKNQRFMMATVTADNEDVFTINPNIVYGGNPSKRDSKVSEYFEMLEKWSENRKAMK